MTFHAQLADAWVDRVTFPAYTEVEPQASLRDAYATQYNFVSELVENQDEVIAGFKAALTAPQAQAAMGIDSPIMGVLFESGSIHTPAFSPAIPCILETELGYRLHTDVLSPVKSGEVLDLVECCMPMMEIAAPNLPGRPKGLDLVAANSASYAWLEGPRYAVSHIDVDNVQTSLGSAGETHFGGSSREVMDGQADALAWLINQALEVGYEVKAGQLFMTGSIGGMTPADPGSYTATFSGLDTLSIEII